MKWQIFLNIFWSLKMIHKIFQISSKSVRSPFNRLNKYITAVCCWKMVCNWTYDYPKSKCIIYFRSTEISRFFELMVTLFDVVMYNIASTKSNLLPLLRIYICLMLSWWPQALARDVSFIVIVKFIYTSC